MKCGFDRMLTVLSLTLALFAVLLLVLVLFPKKDAATAAKPLLFVPQKGKEVPVFQKKKRSAVLLPLLAVLLLSNTLAVLFLALPAPAAARSAAVFPSPSASAASMEPATPEPTLPAGIPALPDAQLVVWLDELTPCSEYASNFSIGAWGDRTPFLVGTREYRHGIGMRLVGTSRETMANAADTPTGLSLRDCKQVSVRYALREQYEKMVFSLGVDASDLRFFGPKDTNGIGRVILADVSEGGRVVLFDSKWQDCEFATYEEELSLRHVDLLEITVMTCGYGGKRVINGLRFVLLDPILFLELAS